jgi:putative heme-binding domain-containing protein
MTNAPDGAVYLADFYEEYIAHGQNYQGQLDPSTGRIYRLRGKDAALNRDVNLQAKSSAELLDLLAHPNRWHRHTAVRLLSERRESATVEPLRLALTSRDQHPALEALWTFHQLGELRVTDATAALQHPAAAVRSWAIRLMGDGKQLASEFHAAVLARASIEPDAEVRAQIAGTARRLRPEHALPLIKSLLTRDEDAADPYIPLLCWWALERHCANHRDAVLAALVWDSAIAKEHILPRLMRRFATTGARADLLTCAQLLESAPSAEHRRLLMGGFEEAWKGRTLPAIPEELARALTASGLASPHLRVRLGDAVAIAEALKVAADPTAAPADRILCVRLFGEVRETAAAPVLLQIACSSEPVELRKAALTSLLNYDLPEAGEKVAAVYTTLPAEVQPVAQTFLTSRSAWSVAFLKLIEGGQVPLASVPAMTTALLLGSADPAVAQLARSVLTQGASVVRPEHQAEIARVRDAIVGGPGDPYRGEPIYLQRCGSCHQLFHKGGSIGPDLTAYQRHDLGTLLQSVIDPGAEIREGFRTHIATTHDGRTLSGFIVDQDPAIVVLRGFAGQDLTIARKEIREFNAAPASLMPEGLLGGLDDQALRDFFAYLRISQPIRR